MVRITVDLLRKRSEHNEGILSTLEEITLHQHDIEKIELIQSHCKHLKILYLQHNLISKIENLYKLKELQYLNMALNNIEAIEGLNTCESLEKLDLTVNFVDLDTFQSSIEHLKPCRNLTDLHMTGNPCTNFKGYRDFVIHTLPQLQKLDGVLITKSQRIIASQNYADICEKLKVEANKVRSAKREKKEKLDTGEISVDVRSHCPEARLLTYKEDLEKKAKEEKESEGNKRFGKPEDPIKNAKKKLNRKESEGPNGELPKQRNIGRLQFQLFDEPDIVRIVIEAPRYLDTSQMEVDIHPMWFQAIIKGDSLVMHLPEEVKANQSKVRRILSTGWLELILPKMNPRKPKPQVKSSKRKGVSDSGKHVGDLEQKSCESTCEESLELLDFDESEVPPLI